MPAGSISADVPVLHFHFEHYPHLMDLLRNEGPVLIDYTGSGGGYENSLKVFGKAVGDWDKK